MAMNDNGFGPFGQFSLAGFLIMGLLALIDAAEIAPWPLSPELTAIIALLAGIGAAALWFGHDPTASERARADVDR
ncbi:hypothetical protein [Halomicrobium salinisoli]|uniref:hypothetical protein n=1 Tax=Halomicrobium salinisoli TaxID=2878391 RepID=UPI001CEFB29F|nr:hypothetical protein [Halomicrobium salinisoli]